MRILGRRLLACLRKHGRRRNDDMRQNREFTNMAFIIGSNHLGRSFAYIDVHGIKVAYEGDMEGLEVAFRLL